MSSDPAHPDRRCDLFFMLRSGENLRFETCADPHALGTDGVAALGNP